MARGGHSHASHSHSHHTHHTFTHSTFSHHHHHRSTYRANYGINLDSIANVNMPPMVINGIYTLQGSQINVMARMNEGSEVVVPPQPFT